MKKKFFTIVIALMTLAVACVKDLEKEGMYNETEIIGTVVENSSNAPVPNIKVKVTDGDHIHASAITGADGTFSLNVNFSEVNKKYYLLLDGSPNLPTKQEPLRGFGNKVYDYKSLVLYDQTDATLLPQVKTGNVSNIMTTTATVSGAVSSNGGHSLTERGICYATHQSPTIDDMRSTAGAELGTFSCNLTGLQTNVTYYVRAYATNTIGTAYGAQKSFTPDGLPTVTTTTPSIAGTTVTTGGNVTSDGGYTVTARGICYGTYPNPDLSSAFNHTTDGSGTGYFTSSFTLPTGSGLYYVRAYATNAGGTTYGELKTVAHPYDTLPTFTYNGHTYKVAPGPHTSADEYISWQAANTYCESLTAYGYSDWRMPTAEEMEMMYQQRESIRGFFSTYTSTSGYTCIATYHTSTVSTNESYHFIIYWNNGYRGWFDDVENYGYGIVESVAYIGHVRPIRMEN